MKSMIIELFEASGKSYEDDVFSGAKEHRNKKLKQEMSLKRTRKSLRTLNKRGKL